MINIIEFEKDRKFLKKLLSRSQFEFYEVNKVV